MPIQEQPLALQFQGGIETKQDSKQVPATKLLDLLNAQFIKQTTLAKRNGYRAASRLIDGGSSQYGDPVGLARRGDELLVFTSSNAYSYRPSTDRWVDTGEVASVVATQQPIGRTGTAQTMGDHATQDGVTVVAWEDSRGGVYASVVETSTGRILLAETPLDASGQAPRCVPCGTMLHVYWVRPAAQELRCALVNPAAPTETPTQTVIVADVDPANPVFDACDAGYNMIGAAADIKPALIAWATVGGGFRVGYIHPSGALGSAVLGLPSALAFTDTITGPIAVAADRIHSGFQVAVAWCDTQVHIRTLGWALTPTLGTVVASATVGTWNRLTLEYYREYPDATAEVTLAWAAELDGSRDDLNIIETGEVGWSGVVKTSSATRRLRGHCLASRAFYDGGHVYAAVVHPVLYFPYVAIVRISGSSFGGDGLTACYARLEPGTATGAPTRKHLASVHAIDPSSGLTRTSREHALIIGYRIQLDSANGDQFGEAGLRLTTLDFDADQSYQSEQIGRGLYLAGACASHYDGRRWAESQFHAAPDTPSGVTMGAEGGAGALAAGSYRYKLCYEEVDALGEVHPGPTSIPFSVVVGASKKITLTIPTYRLTSKRRVRISVFRSIVNAEGTDEEIAHYRVTSLDPTVTTGDNCYIANDPTVDTITFSDNLTDAALLLREPLYTNGGILSNSPSVMAGSILAGGKTRLFWNDPTDPNVVRYSQQLRDDEDCALEAPADLRLPTDPYGGAVVGISALDDAIVVFKETAIYLFGGPGPDADGGLATPSRSWSVPELVTSDVGCKAPNSICQTPNGIVFQSSKGIRLLGRDHQVHDIGAPVYALNDQTISRATLLPDRNAVVFLTASGYTLLWDYERGQWSKWTNHEGYDARVIDGVYHYLRTDGRVFIETPGEYRDDNTQIAMRIETAWIRFADYLQGWQNVLWAYFLGAYKSAHTLVIRYRTNYDDNWSAPINLDVDSNYNPEIYGAGTYGEGVYGGSGGDRTRYQRAVHLNRNCMAIQFRIEDFEQVEDAGASFELSELLLIGGVLGPVMRPGPARTS